MTCNEHFIKIASQTPDVNNALTQIWIGSDFDGIINPVWCRTSVSDFSAFKIEFIKNFMSFAHSNRDLAPLPPGFVNKFADQLFFENGKNFIMQRLQLIHNS